jgi:hypothetical protein
METSWAYTALGKHPTISQIVMHSTAADVLRLSGVEASAMFGMKLFSAGSI